MSEGVLFRPIATIRTDFPDKFGVPRQSGRVEGARGVIVFLPEYRNPEALRGIEGFSHLWLLFDFSLAHREEWSPTVRPPRLGGNRRVGVFASRSPFRPNPVGLSSVRLLSVEATATEGTVLHVAGADLVDGTPIFDVKPYLPFSDAHPEATVGFAEAGLSHRLTVTVGDGVAIPLDGEKLGVLLDCLAEDPRPAYRDEKGRVFSMRFSSLDVHFTVEGDALTVVGCEEK